MNHRESLSGNAIANSLSGLGRRPARGWRALGTSAALATITALGALVPTAQAQTSEPASYWGLSLGQSRYNTPQGNLYSSDRSDTSYKLTYGRHLTPHFGTELSVYDLGKSARGGGETKANGANLSLVGRLPMDRVTLFGKIGANYGRTSTSTALVSDVQAGKATGWGPSVGLGASYDLTPSTALVAEWERSRLEFAGSGRSEVDNTSLGLRWKF